MTLTKDLPSSKGSLEAHERLVKECLEELALMGYAAWENPRRAVQVNGRWVSLTKAGRGDIQAILTTRIAGQLVGLHGEIECKTGQSDQSKHQRTHMKVVRNAGGVYLLARSREEMTSELALLGYGPRHGVI